MSLRYVISWLNSIHALSRFRSGGLGLVYIGIGYRMENRVSANTTDDKRRFLSMVVISICF